MAKNLSIRFTAASSAAAITTSSTPSAPFDELTTGTVSTIASTESLATLLATDVNAALDSNRQSEQDNQLTFCDTKSSPNNHDYVSGVNDPMTCPSGGVTSQAYRNTTYEHPSIDETSQSPSTISKNQKSSLTVIDRLERQLQGGQNPSSAGAIGAKAEPSVTTSWCKFAKTEGTLEIINSNQVESDDSLRERVSITLTPAASTPNQVAVAKTSSAAISAYNSWLADMKLFKDKWSKNEKGDKKGSEETTGNGQVEATRKIATGSQAKTTGPGCGGSGTSAAPSNQVTVSNPYLNNNYLGNNNPICRTCGSGSSRRNQNNVQTQASTVQSAVPIHCSCTRDADQNNKCNTPQRTPTPPLLLSPSEVVFDPNLDPYLAVESPMLFSLKNGAEGKEKKEKKEKEAKKNKLFTGSSSSQSKEKDSSVRKKPKEVKEKEKDKDSSNLKNKIINTTRSSSVSSPSSATNSSSNINAFLSIISKNTSPSHSRYSSTENISLNSDISSLTLNLSGAKNIPKPTSKLPTSRSMISFRKLKSEIDEAVLDDPDASIMMHINNDTRQSFLPQPGNPTLRRKRDSFRRDSPTTIESNFGNDDGLSMASSKSSASSTNLEPSLSQQDLSTEEPQEPPRTSVFRLHSSALFSSSSWAMCFSYAYYIFALVVALLSLLISLISPLPAFFNGLVLGFVCTFLLVTVVIIYAVSNYVLVKSPEPEPRLPSSTDSISLKWNKPKLSINNLFPSTELDSFSGWVYEFIGEYEEREKNGFVSQLVYLLLRGSKLTIFTPSQELNEKRLKQFVADNKLPNFTSQRVIEFTKQSRKRVTLLLTKNVRNQRKYVWSKKYPICLEFIDDRSSNGGGYLIHGKQESPDQNMEFEKAKMPPVSPVSLKLVIFARSCREKEEWFWAVKTAMDMGTNKSTDVSPKSSTLNIAESQGSDSSSVEVNLDSQAQQYLRIQTRRINYNTFMRNNVLNAEGIGPNSSGMMSQLTWFNVLLNRLSFDILNKPNWSAYIAKKLQRKLRKLRLPYFMESLTITEIDIGTTLPKFNSVPSVPVVDDAGLWIDFDVSYSGGFTMTLETKLNLMKLKTRESPVSESVSLSNLSASESGMSTPVSPPESPLISPLSIPKPQKHWCGYKFRASTVSSMTSNSGNDINEEYAVDSDSDLDSIVTSSEDEEPETAPADPDDADTDEKQRKLIRFVDKIASSQYFQKATQINFLRKAIEGVSKMSIMLTVQINSLSGTLAINIPESPSDRLWYGFRNEPTIQITARPKVGDHDLNLHYVTNFIEKKLRTEFFNLLVFPNCDDLYIPALNANIEQYVSVVP